jgi:hypothetical protein
MLTAVPPPDLLLTEGLAPFPDLGFEVPDGWAAVVCDV